MSISGFPYQLSRCMVKGDVCFTLRSALPCRWKERWGRLQASCQLQIRRKYEAWSVERCTSLRLSLEMTWQFIRVSDRDKRSQGVFGEWNGTLGLGDGRYGQ